MATRRGTPRRFHRRIPPARQPPLSGAARTGHAGLQPAVRRIPAGRTRHPAAEGRPLAAGDRSGGHGGRRTLRSGTSGRHPHCRFAGTGGASAPLHG